MDETRGSLFRVRSSKETVDETVDETAKCYRVPSVCLTNGGYVLTARRITWRRSSADSVLRDVDERLWNLSGRFRDGRYQESLFACNTRIVRLVKCTE